jgi:SAM-dependent methyltransferase
MSTTLNYNALSSFVEVDDVDLEFMSVTETEFDGDYNNEETINTIFKYYRKHGFPHYKFTEYEKIQEMRKLLKVSCKDYISDKIVRQTMHGLGLAWSYFPHSWSVRCNDKKSPMDAFNDDESFKKVIRKALMFRTKYEGKLVSDMYIRKILKIATGVQGVSNFRPTAAAAVYENFGGSGVTWDMSCGWGGRLFGALMSKRIHTYIGTDPSTLTYRGLCKIRDDFSYLGKKVELHCLGSESYLPEENSIDLCFTSPPYFDTERYSDEETQSYLKYPNYSEWVNGFMAQTLANVKRGLKKDGRLLINIANAGKFPIETDTIEIARKCGFEFIDELKLSLSALNSQGFKYEPIFVLKHSDI